MGTDHSAAEMSFSRYGIGIVAGTGLALVATILCLGILSWYGRLPPPPMTKVNYMDEKLHFIRQNPNLDPALIVVGSSMALRQFDGTPFESRLGQGHVMNGASTLLKVHQMRFLTNFYMDHFRRLQTIVMIVGPPDFENCTTIPAELFNVEDAAGYAFERAAAAPLYLRYFAPAFYLARARDYDARRSPLLGDLWIDGYGSGPMQVPADMLPGLRYGRLGFDRACVDNLEKLVTEIRQRGIRPVVVFSPIHPEYRRQHPEAGVRLKEIAARIETLVHPGVDFFDWSESDFTSGDFFDAVHLQWTAVQSFSTRLADTMLPGTGKAHAGPLVTGSVAEAAPDASSTRNPPAKP